MVVGFAVHLWAVEARGLGGLVLLKVSPSDVVEKSINGFINVV